MNYIKHFKTTFLLVLFVTLSTNAQVGIGTTTPAYDLDVVGVINLNKGIATGVAMRVNTTEALWYNGTYFSWGFGGDYNFFDKRIGIGVNNPNANYSLDASGALNINKGNNNGVGLYVNDAETIAKNQGLYTWGAGGTHNYFPHRVGIGINNPNANYSLDASGALNVNQGNNNGVGLYLNNGRTIAKNGGLFTWGEDGTANYFPRNIGVLTNAPSTTLDVNGGARVRTLTRGYVVADGQGNLSTDINTSSTSSFPNNIWNGVLVYFKSAVLTFAGKSSNGGNLGFIVHYDVENKTFTPMSQAKCTITDLGATAGNDGRLQVAATNGTHVLTFNITGTTVNITASGSSFLQGSFFSVVNNR